MSEDKLQRISRIIRALLEKTTQNGCSEEEAMSAALKAQELLEAHQLDLSDLELREEGTDQIKVEQDHIKSAIYHRVGLFCECKSWRSWEWVDIPPTRKNARGRQEQREVYNFIGTKGDAFFAEWLLISLGKWIANKKMEYMFGDFLNTPNQFEIQSWEAGVTERINQRLREEVEKRNAERAARMSTGRDLVPLKNAMIKEAFDKLGIKLYKTPQSGTWNPDPRAFAQGQATGDQARFNKPVGTRDSGGQKLIG